MTPRTLWTIILKIFGIYILIQSLRSLPKLLTTLTFATLSANREFNPGESWLFVLLAVLEIGFFVFAVIALLCRTGWVIDTLKLNNGIPEDKLEFNMHRSVVLKIATIIGGIILLIESLPMLAEGLFGYFQQINDYHGFKDYPRAGWIVLELVQVTVGIFMLTSSRLIVNFIERRRKGNKRESTVLPG